MLTFCTLAMLLALPFHRSTARTHDAPPATDAAAGPPIYQDPSQPVPARVADLLARMTLDDKIGQMTQAERLAVAGNEQDIATYRLGSLLSGGGSSPTPNTPESWADMYDYFQSIALSTTLQIPLIYGVDAVHGHNNVMGATIFPHNIGLGATGNPALVQEVGRITAAEVRGTGITWTFSPCLCVARDERWGRTYESFSEDPTLVISMTSIIDGYQGTSLLSPTSILATAKHFVGDGATLGGDDQGDAVISEAELRAIHLPPFRAAIERGVGSVMISYSSWNGEKLHGHRYLITDVLKGELGFDGFVVSDWAAIDQLPGDYASDVRTSINAGLDMIMVPHNYQQFIATLKAEVEAGRVPMERIDDAVSRILTKKFELGLFERPYADRTFTAQVGSLAHRRVARQAVRESQVLLKNEGDLLPLSKNLRRLYVAGKSANDVGNQSGGWTISWQGGSGNSVPGTSVLEGILETVSANTDVTYHRHATTISADYDAAIVVIGETPYTEGQGDIPDVRSFTLAAEDLATLARVKASGVPMAVVLISGRPLDISQQIDDWDSLVAAWLPGTEGGGVADVLFGDYAPTGKLSFTWPRSINQLPINVGDATYDPLFPYGFGLTYTVAPRPFGGTPSAIPGTVEVENFDEGGEGVAYHDEDASNNGGQYRAEGPDIEASNDEGGGYDLGWTGPGEWLHYSVDVTRATTYTLDVRVAANGNGGTFHLELDGADITGPLQVPNTGGWQNWQTISKADIVLPAGRHALRLVLDANGEVMGNFNRMTFTADGENVYLPLVTR